MQAFLLIRSSGFIRDIFVSRHGKVQAISVSAGFKINFTRNGASYEWGWRGEKLSRIPSTFYMHIFRTDVQLLAYSASIVKVYPLVDQFRQLGSNISSTETNINIRIGKAWTAIERVKDYMEI